MPDLDIVPAWTCTTNVFWTTKVEGSRGNFYDVTWRRNDNPGSETVYGWHCSCPAFQYGKGRYCKHIQAVKESGARCAWNEELDPSAVAVSGDPDNRPVCPECGEDVTVFRVGV